jgi:hypothetical protein
MNATKMDFPQYRKYSNGRSYFRISSEKDFEELQFIGDRVVWYRVLAHQYPEMRTIKEMLDLHEGRWERINAIEYASIQKKFDAQGSS